MSKILDGTVVPDTSDYQFFVQMRIKYFNLQNDDPGYIFRGGGVLIDPLWVLTCAHAFTLDPKHLNFDMCLCLNNDSKYEQFIDIEKHILFPSHSKYPGVDAALVKLKSSGTEVGAKTIGLYNFPIDPMEHRLGVRMIGRGHHNSSTLQFNEPLRYHDTRIARPEMCINDISINDFTEANDYCVGEDKVEHIIMTGDSGSPLLIRNPMTEEFEVLGIVSGNIPLTEFDSDGKFEISKNYSRYTKVPAILDWIKETIDNN